MTAYLEPADYLLIAERVLGLPTDAASGEVSEADFRDWIAARCG